MQKDSENIGAEHNSSPETEKNSQSEETVAPKKSAPRKKSSTANSSTAKKATSSTKKSPSKKSTSTSSKTTAKIKTASSKSATVKKAAEIKKEEVPETVEAKTETLDITEISKVQEVPVSEEATLKADDIENVTPPPIENIEEDKAEEEISENDESEFIIPETAVFTTLDTDGEEISLIPDTESENEDGLLNVEHFSDYKPKAEENTEQEPYYESDDSYEEDITILSKEEPVLSNPAVKKSKYEDPDREKYDPKKPRKIDGRFDFIELFVFTLLAVILLTTFIFRHAVVEGPSMQNTLQDGEHLIISNLFYTPKKGDIIVCQDRATGHYDPIVKRVIATEGDTIKITDSVVYLNGERLEEDYVFIDGDDHYSDFPEVTVPEDMIFVMGDHRNNSGDSRAFLTIFVREDAVLGKVILRFYPFDKFGAVN